MEVGALACPTTIPECEGCLIICFLALLCSAGFIKLKMLVIIQILMTWKVRYYLILARWALTTIPGQVSGTFPPPFLFTDISAILIG